jgi:integrase
MRTFADFVKERQYLKNVSPRTIEFYWDCFKSVQKHGDFTPEGLKNWIIGSRQAGVSPASINTRITGVNAFPRWSEADHKLTFLKEEERVLPTYPVEHLKRLIDFKPKGFYQSRLHTLLLTILDTGLRIEEALGLKKSNTDFDNMVFRVRGKGTRSGSHSRMDSERRFTSGVESMNISTFFRLLTVGGSCAETLFVTLRRFASGLALQLPRAQDVQFKTVC